MNLFQKGDFTLSSGVKSDFKIDCDALTDEDIECIAHLIVTRLCPKFHKVVSVPTGGDRLAKALEQYLSPMPVDGSESLTLIVDDVLTTGGSINRMFRKVVDTDYETDHILGVVIFCRASLLETPSWVTPLFFLWPDN